MTSLRRWLAAEFSGAVALPTRRRGKTKTRMTTKNGISRRMFVAGAVAVASAATTYVPRVCVRCRASQGRRQRAAGLVSAESRRAGRPLQKNGVDVEMVWFDDYTASIDALTAGKLDGNGEICTNDAISSEAGRRETRDRRNDGQLVRQRSDHREEVDHDRQPTRRQKSNT